MGNTVGILIVGGIIVFSLAFINDDDDSSGNRGKKFLRGIIFLPKHYRDDCRDDAVGLHVHAEHGASPRSQAGRLNDMAKFPLEGVRHNFRRP